MYDILKEIKNFSPNEKKIVLKNGSIEYQYQKQKFTNLPPRHLLPGEIHQYQNYLIKEKADGILIDNLPIGIFPEHELFERYQVKAEYIEDLDLYLIFDIDIPNTTLIDRYNILRKAHSYTCNSNLQKINNLDDFFEIFKMERQIITNFLKENEINTIKWFPKFACIVNDSQMNCELIKDVILDSSICKKLNNSEPYNCDGLILSPLDGSREIKIKPLSMMTIDIMFSNNKWVDRETNDISGMIISDISPKEGKIYRCNPIINPIINPIKFSVDSYRYDKKKANPGLIIDSICHILKYDWTLDITRTEQKYYYDKPKKLLSKSLISMINSQRDAIFEQISLIKPRVDHNWLDLGCGKGKIIPFIKKYNPKSYLGLDVDVSCLVKCLKFHDEDQDVFIFNKCNLANNWDDTNGQWFSNTKIKYDYIIANFSLMHFFTDLFWEQLDQYVSVGTKFIFNLVSKSFILNEWSESNSFLKIVNDQVIYKFEWIHEQIKIEPFISEDRVIKQLEKSNWKVVSKKIGDSKHELSKFYTWWVIEKI